ncbi:hypothetical protein ACGFIY_32945 [Micromonospora chersina]|uniref:hypothetical protein n=1 Tax=Micromonospora chersina TaxID=47854 RepID=UPI003720FE9F
MTRMHASRLLRIAAAFLITVASVPLLAGAVPTQDRDKTVASVGDAPVIPGHGGKLPDCAALSTQALTTLLGTTVKPQGFTAAPSNASVCAYTLTDDQPIAGTLLIATWIGRQHYAPSAVGATQPLPGLGEEAMADTDRGLILVRSGDLVLLVHVISGMHTPRAAQIATAAVSAFGASLR